MMSEKQYKYQKYLDQFPNCPPLSYTELKTNSFRWIFTDHEKDSFKPMNLSKPPPQRILDKTDLMCKGYGLSMFNSSKNGLKRYKALYKRKRGISHKDFTNEKGDAIGELRITGKEGLFGNLNDKNRHFTFHEFEGTDLSTNIVNVVEIFNKDGELTK